MVCEGSALLMILSSINSFYNQSGNESVFRSCCVIRLLLYHPDHIWTFESSCIHFYNTNFFLKKIVLTNIPQKIDTLIMTKGISIREEGDEWMVWLWSITALWTRMPWKQLNSSHVLHLGAHCQSIKVSILVLNKVNKNLWIGFSWKLRAYLQNVSSLLIHNLSKDS